MHYLLLQEGGANTEDPDAKLQLALFRRQARASSDKPPTGGDRQHIDNVVAAHGDKLVDHVHRDADMVGHDPHDFSDSGRRPAAGQVEEAVFLGHLVDACLGVFADQAEPVQPADVRGECLLSLIHI